MRDGDLEATRHRVALEDRRGAEITGVTDLLIFDETEIVVETTMGLLNVHGQDLHISSLDLDRGQILLEGEINEIYYEDSGRTVNTQGGGFFSKLLRG